MAIDYSGFKFGKGRTIQQAKDKQDRVEVKVRKSVRAECVERDGYCRLLGAALRGDVVKELELLNHVCQPGDPSEWAHWGEKKRARTRKQAPEVRHTKAGSLMLCKPMHEQYDAGKLYITALTRDGCNGSLKFSRSRK